MNLKYKILAVLAAGIALTACGSSGAPASTPASSAVPASSHVAEEGVTEPINLRTWTLDDLDDTQTTTFVSASITSGVQNGKLTAKVFGYDIYKKEEIEKLAVGDKIAFHKEGAAQDQCVTTEVKSIEQNDQHQHQRRDRIAAGQFDLGAGVARIQAGNQRPQRQEQSADVRRECGERGALQKLQCGAGDGRVLKGDLRAVIDLAQIGFYTHDADLRRDALAVIGGHRHVRRAD